MVAVSRAAAVRLLCLLISLVYPTSSLDGLKHVSVVKTTTEFLSSPGLKMVYYMSMSKTYELQDVMDFLKEFDKAAGFLNSYMISTAVVNCENSKLKGCHIKNGDQIVVFYRNREKLVKLDLDAMFDFDSITSNALQLELLDTVPVIINIHERQQLLQESKGRTDVIFSYMNSVGTYAHRVFMQLAYAYQKKFKFAVTMNENVVADLINRDKARQNEVWIFSCLEADKVSGCGEQKYNGNMNFESFLMAVRMFEKPKYFDIPADGYTHPYSTDMTACVFLYYSNSSRDETVAEAEKLHKTFIGIIGIVLVNTDIPKVRDFLQFSGKTPALSVKLRNTDAQSFYDSSLNPESIQDFIWSRLNESNDSYPYTEDSREEDEELDDEVAFIEYENRKIPMELEKIPSLTDKTFLSTVNSSDFIVILFYFTLDVRSMMYLRDVGTSFTTLKRGPSHVASLECFDWTDVCAKENVNRYPTVRVYRPGQSPVDYVNILDGKHLVKFVSLLELPSPVLSESVEEVDDVIRGMFKGIGNITNHAVIGLLDDIKEITAFKAAAESLHGSVLFIMVTGTAAHNVKTNLEKHGLEVSVPVIVAVRWNDLVQKFTVNKDLSSAAVIAEFAQSSVEPVFPELTPSVIPKLHKDGQPFVVLFVNETEKSKAAKDAMTKIVTSGAFTKTPMFWLNVTQTDSVGDHIMKAYFKNPEAPELSLVFHQKGIVHNFEHRIFDVDAMSLWLRMVLDGKQISVPSNLTWKEWKPLKKNYPFLNDIEESDTEESSDYSVENEYGLGFDADGNYYEDELALESEGSNADALESEGTNADALESEGTNADALESEGTNADALESEGTNVEALENVDALESEGTSADDSQSQPDDLLQHNDKEHPSHEEL